jgi:hypothetical protein
MIIVLLDDYKVIVCENPESGTYERMYKNAPYFELTYFWFVCKTHGFSEQAGLGTK